MASVTSQLSQKVAYNGALNMEKSGEPDWSSGNQEGGKAEMMGRLRDEFMAVTNGPCTSKRDNRVI